ncbi:ankyrin repeat protein [Catovirus CTV1]|uniref:Ankyrin repeat protein n=1 Tax=Catovirus CTV1 TaxID=1977631 RepID=A0A1V0SA58_9VIRU|nr:ankyrin repeat protein [Catovirus CTV1]
MLNDYNNNAIKHSIKTDNYDYFLELTVNQPKTSKYVNYAIKNQRINFLEKLLCDGYDLHMYDGNYNSLYTAIYTGNIRLVKFVVESAKTIDLEVYKQAIRCSLSMKVCDILEFMVQCFKKNEVHVDKSTLTSLVSLGLYHKYYNGVKILMENLYEYDNFHYDITKTYKNDDDLNINIYLMEKSEYINKLIKDSHKVPFTMAIKNNSFELIKYFFEKKIYISSHETLLEAISKCDYNTLEYLLDNTKEYTDDDTIDIILSDIIKNNNFDIFKLLINKKKICYIKTFQFVICLTDTKYLQYLIDFGITPDPKYFNNYINNINIEAVKLLKKYDKYKNYIFFCFKSAISGNNIDIIKYLLNNDDVFKYNLLNQSVLDLAISRENIDIIEFVCKNISRMKNCDEIIKNKPENSTLNSAIETRNIEIVKQLYDLGAQIMIYDDDKCDIIYDSVILALYYDCIDIVEFLVGKEPNLYDGNDSFIFELALEYYEYNLKSLLYILDRIPIDNSSTCYNTLYKMISSENFVDCALLHLINRGALPPLSEYHCSKFFVNIINKNCIKTLMYYFNNGYKNEILNCGWKIDYYTPETFLKCLFDSGLYSEIINCDCRSYYKKLSLIMHNKFAILYNNIPNYNTDVNFIFTDQ